VALSLLDGASAWLEESEPGACESSFSAESGGDVTAPKKAARPKTLPKLPAAGVLAGDISSVLAMPSNQLNTVDRRLHRLETKGKTPSRPGGVALFAAGQDLIGGRPEHLPEVPSRNQGRGSRSSAARMGHLAGEEAEDEDVEEASGDTDQMLKQALALLLQSGHWEGAYRSMGLPMLSRAEARNEQVTTHGPDLAGHNHCRDGRRGLRAQAPQKGGQGQEEERQGGEGRVSSPREGAQRPVRKGPRDGLEQEPIPRLSKGRRNADKLAADSLAAEWCGLHFHARALRCRDQTALAKFVKSSLCKVTCSIKSKGGDLFLMPPPYPWRIEMFPIGCRGRVRRFKQRRPLDVSINLQVLALSHLALRQTSICPPPGCSGQPLTQEQQITVELLWGVSSSMRSLAPLDASSGSRLPRVGDRLFNLRSQLESVKLIPYASRKQSNRPSDPTMPTGCVSTVALPLVASTVSFRNS
jgi:hypothetical protein